MFTHANALNDNIGPIQVDCVLLPFLLSMAITQQDQDENFNFRQQNKGPEVSFNSSIIHLYHKQAYIHSLVVSCCEIDHTRQRHKAVPNVHSISALGHM